MPQVLFTDKLIRNLKAEDGVRIEYSDSMIANDGSLPGSLILRVGKTGKKTWQIVYRVSSGESNRKLKRCGLGQYPALPLTKARENARDKLQEAARGIDPAQKKQSELTVGVAAAEYVERYAKPNQRRWKETQRILNAELIPTHGGSKLSEVTTTHIRDVINTIESRGASIQANRTLQTIKAFWRWLIDRGYSEMSPADPLRPPTKERSRERVLEDTEVQLFWNACKSMGYPFGSVFQLLLLTAQRRQEVSGIRWSELDLDGCEWRIPASKTKSNREHIVPLSAPAISIISKTPRFSHDLLFSNTGTTAVSGFSRAKRKLDGLMQDKTQVVTIMPWRLHDLRRTATSGMARLGSGQVTIEKVLNHSSGKLSGVAAIYNRYGYQKEKSEALNDWANYVMALVKE